ncbi:MAG: hypothetical protein ACI8PZ_006621 [Myxococcota bacterium]|jgi:hypothetical protein
MSEISLEKAKKDPIFKEITALIQKAFPGTTADIALVALMLEGLKASEADFVRSLEQWLSAPIASVTRDTPTDEAVDGITVDCTTYHCESTHLRMTPIYSCFTGIVKAVRVRLQQTARLPYMTPYGIVWNHDHIVFTVDDMREWIAKTDPNFMSFERVDLITPARKDLVRFAPVAVFLGYAKADDPVPSFFVLESGLATGEPAVLYLAPTIDSTIDHRTAYMPTPFTSPNNWYLSTLTLQDGDEPKTLVIEGREHKNERPYISITLSFAVESQPGEIIEPIRQVAEAAIRIAAIGDGLGCVLGLIDEWVAKYGLRHYPWNLSPAGNDPTTAA